MSTTEAAIVPTDQVVSGDDQTNAKQLLCLKCSSKILAPGKGHYEETDPTELHVMHKKLEAEGVEKESIKQVNYIFRVQLNLSVGFFLLNPRQLSLLCLKLHG